MLALEYHSAVPLRELKGAGMPGYAPAVNMRAQMASKADRTVCEVKAHDGVLP
jgi:hypothetical protein